MRASLTWVILALLTLFSSACQSEAAIQAVPSGGVLFQDDFERPAGGWKLSQDTVGAAEYAAGGIRITVNAITADYFTVAGLNLDDVAIDVDTLKVSGPDNNDFGVICRYRDTKNFYFLKITSDGYYVIGKFKDDEMILLGMSDYQPAPMVLQGSQVNHLRAECKGSSLRLTVNGMRAGEAEDGDFASGDVGLIAGTFGEAGVVVLFDNFSVTKP